MQRLVYNPKVEVFVRTDSGVIDLTDYVVSGSVNRVVNEVSTANITIRNPDKRFTEPGRSTLHPMDGITIFGSRYPEHRVQMFTGYLDKTPYLQLFPGTCTIDASCTLKRLQYTYWDPGIPFTRHYLNDLGWFADPQSGTIQNPQAIKESVQEAGGGGLDQGKKKVFTDGSIGNLLRRVLIDAGNWDPDQVFIEQLPPSLYETVGTVISKLNKDDVQLKQEVEAFLKKLIGPYTPGSGTTATGQTSTSDSGNLLPPGDGDTILASFYGQTPADEGGAPGCGGQNGLPAASTSHDLHGGMCYAELNYGQALGGLPCNQATQVTYKDRSVIAYKTDTGAGGNGASMDLFIDLADTLGFDKDKGIDSVTIKHLTPNEAANAGGGN